MPLAEVFSSAGVFTVFLFIENKAIDIFIPVLAVFSPDRADFALAATASVAFYDDLS